MEFFKIRRTIPFMRHALIFNVISLITFLAAVFFLVHRGLNFSIEFTGGTLLEVNYQKAADVDAIRKTLDGGGFKSEVQNFGSSRDVLINERIREELRGGATPQAAIAAGYERAWATILDSNVTTLIVGLSLLMVPGAVRGFAVVHCLGILTSMFSAVVVSRAIVNLTYGHRRRVARLSIGNTAWR